MPVTASEKHNLLSPAAQPVDLLKPQSPARMSRNNTLCPHQEFVHLFRWKCRTEEAAKSEPPPICRREGVYMRVRVCACASAIASRVCGSGWL